MARVVQKRSGPPYLLILTAILWVTATVLAVFFYVQGDESERLAADAKKKLAAARKERDQLKDKNIPRLAKAITGNQNISGDDALAESERALAAPEAEPHAHLGLAGATGKLIEEINARQGQIAQLTADRATLEGQLDTVRRGVDAIKTAMEAKVTKARNDLQTAKDETDRAVKRANAQLATAMAEKAAVIDKQQQQIAAVTQQKEALERKAQLLGNQLALVTKQLQDLKGHKNQDWVYNKYDATIARALPDRGVVYINLGAEHGIKPGLPMAIFAEETGVSKKAVPKGKIVVISVGPTTSECRITQSKAADPMVKGDLAVNIVYDRSRVREFVVEGDFDLSGEGRADPTGGSRVKALIERFGGKVADTISIETDFVVLGTEPLRPDTPPAGAPGTDWQIYKQRMAKYAYYTGIKELAARMNVPILSMERFMIFSGYVPRQTLTR